MKEPRLDRRTFLAAAGAGLAGAAAGCTEPGSSIPGSSVSEIDRDNLAEGSTYTEVYEATIDSVLQVRVFGVPDPDGGEDRGRGQGSGFLFGDAHVVTNHHVVYDAEEIDLRYINGDWTEARVVGTDFYSDLAVLEVDHVPGAADPLPMTEQFPVPGQRVLAIGNPFGLEGSMSEGIVSGVDRSLTLPGREYAFPNVVQTDTPINPGNSGGPLVDLEGRVVGVVNAAGGQNIGFAISSALARRVVPELIERGEYDHSRVGIRFVSVDRLVAEENDLEEAAGVMVVEASGPAADAGLDGADRTVERHGEPIPVAGDVVRRLDGEPIPDEHALSSFLALETSPGDEIAVEFVRDGETRETNLVLGTRPDPNEEPLMPSGESTSESSF
ncbi:S1C family serine protease [Natrialbaceae archaeon GCM10025810]|uniref:S1C family serine protease n=1 Tax=Halovalidus salilacus TaxID=3075124 RepID=UPI00361F3A90